MRIRLFVFPAAFAALLLSGCASIRDGATAAFSGIRISSPAFEGLGFAAQDQILTIVNPFDAPAELVAYNDTFGEIRPGETLSLVKGYEPFWMAQVPLVLVFKRGNEYLGCAGKVIEAGANAPSVVWDLGKSGIRRYGKSAPLGFFYGRRTFRKASLPRCLFQGSSWLQIMNDSPRPVEISLAGNRAKRVAPGRSYAARATGFSYGWSSHPRPIPVIVNTDADGRGSILEYWLNPVTQGVSAEQRVISSD